ncbi:MAG: hypothetical protein NVSMB23_15380 [Myxococcales bacterium]
MAQNSQSATASRGTVPGTANEAPVAPNLFTAPRREYIPDAKRVRESLQTEEMARARTLFDEGDYQAARREAKLLLKRKDAPALARSEAADLIDRTDLDHGPLATAVAFLILLGLLLMFFSVNGT